jgi:hypothetical protein
MTPFPPAASTPADTALPADAGPTAPVRRVGAAIIAVLLIGVPVLPAVAPTPTPSPAPTSPPSTLADLPTLVPMCATPEPPAGLPALRVTSPPVRVLWNPTSSHAGLPPGRYAYFATRRWEHDITDSLEFPEGVAEVDGQIWQAADGSGYIARDVTRWDPEWPGPWTTTQTVILQPHRPSELDTRFLAWSDDPRTFAAQVDALAEGDPWPGYVLDGIAYRYASVLPTPAQDAAARHVLCTTRGLRLLGDVTDLAGRTGVAIDADEGHPGPSRRRITLILNPRTWRPLAMISVRFTGTAYTLYLDAGPRDVR